MVDKILKCICCGKIVNRIYNDTDYSPESDMWKNAGVHDFIPGYGSRYDSMRFVIAICDDCIEKNLDRMIITDENIYY